MSLLLCYIVASTYSTLRGPCEKSKMVSFTTSRMKNTYAPYARSKFFDKIIVFGLAWSACFFFCSFLFSFSNLLQSFYGSL